jgi:predicted regulator of Ras-like GTPase activity (Roadblock/LC7/MglB family)
MSERILARATGDIPSLRAVFLTAMPECLLYDSWLKGEEEWAVDDIASYFGDLIRANREALKALQSWSADMQVTIESSDSMIILRELTSDFVCGAVFERDAPLGMVRLNLKRLLDRITAQLPSYRVEERPRGVRVVEFLQRYAPDPHAVLLRVALRTGIPVESLEKPEGLEDQQVAQVEDAARRILGLAELNI